MGKWEIKIVFVIETLIVGAIIGAFIMNAYWVNKLTDIFKEGTNAQVYSQPVKVKK